MSFIAIDVETANPDMASICQIGAVKFENGTPVKEWASLVDPEDYFDGMNVGIHGITERDVLDSPTFPEIANELEAFLEGAICVCHTHFDRVAISQALSKHQLPAFSLQWLDSARVARRTWIECAWRNYGLAKVCKMIGHDFNHHDALEDAKAAGHVLLAAMEHTGIALEGWLARVEQPIDPCSSSSDAAIRRSGNPEGDLFGETLVFTGSLAVVRRDAANMAASVGCNVASDVTKKTTILVVGDQDIDKLAGKKKSSKHRKAERLIENGQDIRIIKEADFKMLVKTSHLLTSM